MELQNSTIAGVCGDWAKELVVAQESTRMDVEVLAVLSCIRALSGSVFRLPGTKVGFYLGDFPGLLELHVQLALGTLLTLAFAALGWAIRTSPAVPLSAKRVAIVGMAVCWALLPFACFAVNGPMRSQVTHMSISLQATLGFFRLVELACGTGPKGFDVDLRRWALYSATVVQVAFDDEGRIKPAPKSHVRGCARSVAIHILLYLGILAIGERTRFVPGLKPDTDLTSLTLLGFPWSFPAAYLQVWHIYCGLTISFQFWRCVLGAFNIGTEVPMRQPLLFVTGVRDFWGRRWNLLVHSMMKRTMFGPCAKRLGARAGAVVAFGVSGLFHEYMWLVVNWFDMMYSPGGPCKFFVTQFLLCMVEASLKDTGLGQMVRILPQPVQTVLTTVVTVPFSPYFLQGLHLGGLMMSSTALFPHPVVIA